MSSLMIFLSTSHLRPQEQRRPLLLFPFSCSASHTLPVSLGSFSLKSWSFLQEGIVLAPSYSSSNSRKNVGMEKDPQVMDNTYELDRGCICDGESTLPVFSPS